ncbi:MAG TPA: phospholipase D-like domain-containing protein [bacterium]|jgi:phosphatidylserine/phosphatidylglycerophosphate/cardiolipin synthase-like enzyme|nr:phospholipase D-like domain-containing protein [bacterium]HOG37976.1 phospholipase D-like domain-containing protein [bacterium]HQI03035.1 phospholipase D-like domain-containing protein [bacterium]
MKLEKSHKTFIFWAIPILLLITMGIFIYLFFTSFSKRRIVEFRPAKIIEITEPFSGSLHFNDEFGQNILSKIVIDSINSAQKTIEVAIYSMNDERIRDAIYKASDRGVNIKLVFSDVHRDINNRLFSEKRDNITRKDILSRNINTQKSEYMHHKFIIIDRGEETQKLLFSSYNFTYIQDKYDPSFILETDRPEIIEIYGEEFDRIFSGLRGRDKLSKEYNPFAALIKYPEGFLEIWFTPQRINTGIKDRMLNLIENSKDNIKSMIWLMTDRDIAEDLLLASKKISVKILTDDYNFSVDGSVFNFMIKKKKQNHLDNLEILTDENRNKELKQIFNEQNLNSFLHHHLMIFDDKIALFGTNNWSSGGFFRNDESIMVSNIPSLVSDFNKSFEFNYNRNKYYQ